MPYISREVPLNSPAEMVLLALAATAIGIGLLLIFILYRRALRQRYFQRRDRRVQFIRDNWQRILSSEIAIREWFSQKIDREVVEEILLERIETAESDEVQILQEFARRSGLVEQRIRQVRRSKGWVRRLSLIALGRTQLPESIPVLSEALQDPHDETVVDAIRGLGQVGTPEAAEPIMRQVSQKPQQCPPQTVQTALVNCYRWNPQLLLDKVLKADDVLRPTLARVLAEVANLRISGDLLGLAADPLTEVRASAARIIAVVRPPYALSTLSLLAGDPEWFVRLRAVVAMGDLQERRVIPLLVNALCDPNRFVRLRAASALVSFEGEEERVMQLAMQTGDRYALQALVSEMERSGRLPEMVNSLAVDFRRPATESVLLVALQNGSMRILTDLLLNHPDRRVRARLARILAGSGEVSLLQHLVQINTPQIGLRKQRLLHWVISHLRKTIETIQASKEVVPV